MAQIYKRNNKWAVRVYFLDSEGTRHSKNKSGFKTKKEAEIYANTLENEKNKGANLFSKDITLSDYFSNWIKTYKLNRFSETTDQKYIYASKLIKEYFNDTKLSDINKATYQKFLDEYGKNHIKDNTSRINGYIRASLQDAIDEQIIQRDFTRRALLSGNKSKSSDLKYLEYDEAAKLKKIVKERENIFNISACIIDFALATGCRYGEIVGLTWDCVNFTDKTVNINKTYDYKKRNGFKTTKNESSVRLISIDSDLLEMLKKLQLEQRKIFLKQGYKNKLNLVFINNRHEVPSPNGAKHVLQPILKSINAKNIITMHGLRHTHASILISKGLSPAYIAERLGHSSTAITERVYIHLLKDRRDEENQRALNILQSM
ncbi:tyrosine-type recombinase/integrase [Companilactobacillus sp. DQM5]|uniref:tyrosine-type recombinase/integrase n=1 Tax=Companilactobacillus sp. DQM5 TaxID=3463359 RepID=UPI0040580FF8